MPGGVPVAIVGIGNGGNAGLPEVFMPAMNNTDLQCGYAAFQERIAADSRSKNRTLIRETTR
jgi:phosphoribosylcarboxyaminoimidazole (NCAIR) mutase